jgi:hypothetical protein
MACCSWYPRVERKSRRVSAVRLQTAYAVLAYDSLTSYLSQLIHSSVCVGKLALPIQVLTLVEVEHIAWLKAGLSGSWLPLENRRRCVCDVVERVVSIEQQTAHIESTERATAKGMCISTDYCPSHISTSFPFPLLSV